MTNDNTKKLTIQPREKISIRSDATVKTTLQGDRFAEVLYMSKTPKQTIKKLDKHHYLVLKTNEIREFEEHAQKQRNSLSRTFAELRGIIRANFDGEGDNQVFLTLTYAENMKDPERLYEDFDLFWKRLKYHLKGHKLEYVAVAEPQARGAWHMHVMIKSDQPVLYIDNKLLTTFQPHPRIKDRAYRDPKTRKPVINGGIWGHGYTTCERLKGDDRGRYYEAYFTSLEFDDQTIVQARKGTKKYKKGARLPLYPLYFKLYRCSRGIVRPHAAEADYGLVVKEYGKPYHVSSYDVLKDGEHLNFIQHESFKKKREEQENQPPKT